MLIIKETGYGVYSNSLYYRGNNSVNLSCSKIKRLFFKSLERSVQVRAGIVSTVSSMSQAPPSFMLRRPYYVASLSRSFVDPSWLLGFQPK